MGFSFMKASLLIPDVHSVVLKVLRFACSRQVGRKELTWARGLHAGSQSK